MTDPLRFPAADIVDLYSHRWEIELGYREMKQSLLGNRLTLRSRTWRWRARSSGAPILPWVSPERVPGVIQSMLDMAPAFVLPERRERTYPRSVRRRPQKYSTKKEMPVSAN